jgi:hypothetical protein
LVNATPASSRTRWIAARLLRLGTRRPFFEIDEDTARHAAVPEDDQGLTSMKFIAPAM